nr:retrovirus-related Pol polyprotein from transposon TNT 1-94 [Tanacetum cinerariifolium]
MILNTLDNLGKFEEKGDEVYFLGYSMSSKAFRSLNDKDVDKVPGKGDKGIGKGSGVDNQEKFDSGTQDNRVLVTKPHNKTPYELLTDRSPNLDFMRPFGCPITILNTLDHLGKFEGKADKGFLVGYSVNCKAFRVFNSRTRKVEENLHIRFLENKSNVTRRGLEWLFDIDSLAQSMKYKPVTTGNQTNNATVGLVATVLTYLAVLVDATALRELCLAVLTGTLHEFVITAVGTKLLLGKKIPTLEVYIGSDAEYSMAKSGRAK